MTEYRVVTFTQPTRKFFAESVGAVSVQTLDFAGSIPELAEHMDGWEAVNFQLIPNGEVTYLSILLKTELAVPDLEHPGVSGA
jgi:hypothetical protein